MIGRMLIWAMLLGFSVAVNFALAGIMHAIMGVSADMAVGWVIGSSVTYAVAYFPKSDSPATPKDA